MISRFDPLPLNRTCERTETVEYMTLALSIATDQLFTPFGFPSSLFYGMEMEVCGRSEVDESDHTGDGDESGINWPIVLLSPGFNATRTMYSLLAQQVASLGYIVISIDHPYDTTVEFPDGTLAVGGNMNLSDPISVVQSLDIRVKDLSFVLDALSLPPNASVLAFGHSFGGAGIAQAMVNETRIRGGVNLDGGLFGSVVNSGLFDPKQAFINWGAEGHNRTSQPDWGTFYGENKKRGIWQRELGLRNAAHGTFWDLPSLVDFKGVRGNTSAVGLGFLGALDGKRVLEILSRYLDDYFGFVLRGNEGEGLLTEPNGEFPEVLFLG